MNKNCLNIDIVCRRLTGTLYSLQCTLGQMTGASVFYNELFIKYSNILLQINWKCNGNDKKMSNLIIHLIKAVLIDLCEISFQFALKSAVYELKICTLHQNGIAFHQKPNEVCFRIDMPEKLAICRHFLFTYTLLLIHTHLLAQYAMYRVFDNWYNEAIV